MKKILLLTTSLLFAFFLNAQVSKTVNISAGGLSAALTTVEFTSITNLTVTGSIDARDIKCMRDGITNLAVLDISAVTIQEYTGNAGAGDSVLYPSNQIPQFAFMSFFNLTNIIIPNTVTSIGHSAFKYCRNLTSITIPNTVKSIGDYAFESCNKLASFSIPDSVTLIGDYVFSDCSSLTSISISNKVTALGDHAFSGCTSLTSISIGNSVISIGSGAFSNCFRPTSIIIPHSVKSIGHYAFYQCSGLTSIVIPNSVTSIGNDAFGSCTGLNSVTASFLNNNTTDTNNNHSIFTGCHRSISLTIPDEIIAIRDNAFSKNNCIISLTIPNTVKSIGDYAFFDCPGLTSISFGDSVTSIGDHAFYGCSSLTNVKIPNSVTSIGATAFSNCTSLTSINIPNSVTSLGSSAFFYCYKLTSITIPNSLTSIGGASFYGCSGLTSIFAYASTPAVLSSGTFYLVNENACTLYVPAGSKEAYQAAPIWGDFNIVEMAPTALPTLASESVNIYPNPVTDGFQINGLEGLDILTLTDLSGKTLLTKQVQTNDYVSVDFLRKGVYLVKITTANGIIERKVIKK